MKKRASLFLLILLVLVVLGFEAWGKFSRPEQAAKDQYYHVLNGEGHFIAQIDDAEQIAAINDLILFSIENAVEPLPEDAKTRYVLVAYQAATPLAGETPRNEGGYEEVLRLYIYDNLHCVTVENSPGLVKNMSMPRDMLTLTYFTTPAQVRKVLDFVTEL